MKIISELPHLCMLHPTADEACAVGYTWQQETNFLFSGSYLLTGVCSKCASKETIKTTLFDSHEHLTTLQCYYFIEIDSLLSDRMVLAILKK